MRREDKEELEKNPDGKEIKRDRAGETEREHEGCCKRRRRRRRRWRGGKKGGEGGDCLAKEPLTTYDHVIN